MKFVPFLFYNLLLGLTGFFELLHLETECDFLCEVGFFCCGLSVLL